MVQWYVMDTWDCAPHGGTVGLSYRTTWYNGTGWTLMIEPLSGIVGLSHVSLLYHMVQWYMVCTSQYRMDTYDYLVIR